MKTLDLADLDSTAESTFDVPVAFDADGNAIAGFKVVGKNSTKYRNAKRRQDVIAVKKSTQRGGKAPDGKTDEGALQYLEDSTARESAIVRACVVDWYGFTKNGAAIALTDDELVNVFEKRPTWFDKVSASISTDANFTQS